jgi:small subunit ribosomal protein S6
MRLYETTFILSPQADDATFDRQIKAVGDVLSRYSGKVMREYRWGIRRLAYPIKRFTQGFYARLIFEGNNKALSELERFYKIEEPYIRYLTVVYEGNLEEEADHGTSGSYEAATAKPFIQPEVAKKPEVREPIPDKDVAVESIEDKADKFEEKYGNDDI